MNVIVPHLERLWCQRIQTVRSRAIGVKTVTDICSDMYEAYLTAIEEIFGADISVIDRFHVAQHYYDAADSLRKAEMVRLKRVRKKREYDLLKGVMWYFRRRPTDITPEEQELLECLFSAAASL